jgi:hypothetical protein
MEEWVVNAMPRLLYPWERPGTHCIRGWVGPHSWSGQVRKILLTPGFDSQTFHTVVSRYANYIIPAPTLYYIATVTPGPLVITFEKKSAKCFPRVAAGQRKMDHEHNSNTIQ